LEAGNLISLLESLPRMEGRPFLAALPQAALANPQGPLAVIGNSDLVWSYPSINIDPLQRRLHHSRLASAMQVLAMGSRVGVAFNALMRAGRELTEWLLADYQVEQDASSAGRPAPSDRMARVQVWMERNMLRGCMLLGDPAIRLPRDVPADDSSSRVRR
jgi:hypothetical protein